MSRILVATADALTSRMAGPAIRAWQIADALSRQHEVVLFSTSKCTVVHPHVEVRTGWDAELRELERWCDVIVFQGFLMDGHPVLRRSEKVMVVDVYDPFHLEQLEQSRDAESDHVRREVVHSTTAVLNEQLLRGDFFLCASTKQRDFWLGQLAGLGRINPLTYDVDETLESLITVVPFGVPDDAPVHTRGSIKGVVPGIGPDDKVVLWGGGIYNWFDPLTLIRAVDRLRHRRPELRLFFMGLKHPNPAVPEMRMAVATRRLAEELGLVGTHVFFNEGWVPYDERQNYLLEADIGVSTHLDHVETAFSFRTRILDYIWTALPIVCTEGDSLAELVESRALGLTVAPGQVEALECALDRLLDDDEFSALCRKNLAALAPELSWSQVLQPLVRFCAAPRRAPDLVHPDMRGRLRRGLANAHRERRGWRHDVDSALRHLRHGRSELLLEGLWRRLRRR